MSFSVLTEKSIYNFTWKPDFAVWRENVILRVDEKTWFCYPQIRCFTNPHVHMYTYPTHFRNCFSLWLPRNWIFFIFIHMYKLCGEGKERNIPSYDIWKDLNELIWLPISSKCTYLFRHISVYNFRVKHTWVRLVEWCDLPESDSR